MAVLDIVTVPDKVLKARAEEIEEIDERIIQLAQDMADTMYKAPGIGLAANQVGEPVRLVVLDVEYAYASPAEKTKNPLFLINPEITESEGKAVGEEGCLSVPEFGIEIERDDRVKIQCMDLDGNCVTIEADGLLARAAQHEMDHLDGCTILDHASSLRKSLYLRKQKKKNRRE